MKAAVLKRTTVAGMVMALLVFAFLPASAQEGLVRNRLAKIANGQSSEVKQELPDLLAEYPDDPGVRLLHAMLVEDAVKALPLYERIVSQYPDSEWADDAQWRIVQIYAVKGDAGRARAALEVMRQKYPTSQFLVFATQLVKETVGLAKTTPTSSTPTNTNQRRSTQPETQSPSQAHGLKETAVSQVDTPPPSQPRETNPRAEVRTESSNSTTKYTLQVGLFSNKEAADVELERFRKLRMRSGIHVKSVDGVDKYAVTVGEYSSRESADRARQTVQKYCGCTPFIVEIVGD